MRRIGLGCLVAAGLILAGVTTHAQTSLDVLEQDLNQIKQQHQDASSQVVTDMLSALDAASRSTDAALSLYQDAGGTMPQLTPVTTTHEHETPDEKAAREAKDNANASALAAIAQVHCGMMRFAALFIVKPDTQGLQDQWTDWLKSTAPHYADLKGAADLPDLDDNAGTPPDGQESSPRRRRWRDSPVGKHVALELMRATMKDSIISQHLNFHGWGDKEQGQWKVIDLPKIYRQQILDPLRAAHNPDELAAWDIFIAMSQANQPDADRWAHVDYPSLAFEKDCDDFDLAPSTEKLAALVELLKTCPDHPQMEDMTNRVHQMLQDYRAQKTGGGTSSATNSAPADPNVTVTTAHSGDTTVITTTTNTPPAAPDAPKN